MKFKPSAIKEELCETTIKLTTTQPKEPQEEVPTGFYEAIVKDITVTMNPIKQKKVVRIDFSINSGEHQGKVFPMFMPFKLSRNDNPRYNSWLFRAVTTLIGQEPDPNEAIELKELIGKECSIVLNYSFQGNWMKVTEIFPKR